MLNEFSQLPQVVHGERNDFLVFSDGHRHEPIEVLQPIYLLEITSSILCPDLSFIFQKPIHAEQKRKFSLMFVINRSLKVHLHRAKRKTF